MALDLDRGRVKVGDHFRDREAEAGAGIWRSRAFEPRRKRRNMVSSSSAGMPMPSSRTSIVQPPSVRARRDRHVTAGGS
jgi:hypothetical protein